MSGLKLLLVCACIVTIAVKSTSAVWQQPYFHDANTSGVYFQSAVGVQKINVHEELSWPFPLAIINYEGVGTPTLGAFEIGDNSLLGARIAFNENVWFLMIEKRQDYENPNQRIYSFQIYIKDDPESSMEQGILLTLENIFDNNPSITYSPSPCRVQELQGNYLTDCVFSIYDPDGMDRNSIRIDTDGQNNEADLFDFVDFGEVTTYEKHFRLKIKEELHYENRAIYNLEVRVHDGRNNTGHIFAIVEVIDLPNRDPIWVRPLTTATFDEKKEQHFQLKAIDGDTGINKPICYRLEFEDDYSDLMSIDVQTGMLHVQPIDRDALNQQIFTFYTTAYKCDNITWSIRNLTILIVQDINDNLPVITLVPQVVQIMEAKYLTLPLRTFFVEDIDLGNNATYSVYLDTHNGTAYSEALTLIPSSGYQQTNFSLTVIQAESLDYENEQWRSFDIMLTAKEVADNTHTTSRTLRIELVNWNDEWPTFTQKTYEVSVLENIPSGTFLHQVYATDRDVDDVVVHSIVGNMPVVEINATTGVITTSDNNAFDYERQSVVMLQIQAKDSLITTESDDLHTSFAQLVINIIDVNDETPELRMPRSIVNITENAAPYTLLTDKIEARDPDTSANLTFEIIWTASYATKSGQEANSQDFINCFIVERKVESQNLIYGLLRVNPAFGKQVDYEKYDTIFLTIKVTDRYQETNEDFSIAVLTIRVDDVNDNPPIFASGTLEELRKVTEKEEDLTVIGTIGAFDVDGPGNNDISFAIRPIGDLTLTGLVTINITTGVMRVNGAIECDLPKVFFLEYEVILTDMLHTTKGRINISVIDINNRLPTIDQFEQQVAIYENASTGHFVGQIKAHDDDRDAPHNVLEYSLNSASVASLYNLFQINITNGIITVNLRSDLQLDRDNGVAYYYIPVDIKDNFNINNPGYGPVNQRTTFLNVTLLDVNDNAPIMPTQTLFAPEFSEADKVGTYSKPVLRATDKDEENTPNAWISYRVLSLKPARDNAPNLTDYADLFDIVGDERTFGKLRTLRDLKGLYGYWTLEIEAYDHGEPSMRNTAIYEIYVRPFNFHAPRIIYPIPNKSLRVCYALQEPNRPLYQDDCVSHFSLFEAHDPDGAEYGDVEFHLSSDSGDHEKFRVVKENRNQSHLYVQEVLPAGIYNLIVRATDGGGSSSEEVRNVRVVFVDMLGNPMFLEHTFHTNFTENNEGRLESRYIPAAYDPKNEGLSEDNEQYKLYYFIDDTFSADEAKLFLLDSETRLLTLQAPLDREVLDTLHIRVKVTNNENGIIINPNSVNYLLDVIITVNDLNDNPPKFTQNFYAGGITLKDSIGKDILFLHADDPDLNDAITYEIVRGSMETHGDHIDQIQLTIFTLNRTTGWLQLDSYVTNNMAGYFMFNVSAMDAAQPAHTDIVAVKIYIVSEANRVKFVFLSDITAIRDNEQFIREEFQQIYGYDICNIDSVDDVTNQQKQPLQKQANEAIAGAFITDVVLHFIDNNEAIEAREIQRRSTDLAFISKLQNTLQRRNLILNDVPHLTSSEEVSVVANWLLTMLVIISVFLTAVCATLIVVFVVKMRTMKRQLKAFEPPEFGSIASNLNRIGGTTTNIFSVEGSNPVMNHQSNTLAKCGVYEEHTSSESEDDEDDFDGVHDDPIFDMNTTEYFEKPNQPDREATHEKLRF